MYRYDANVNPAAIQPVAAKSLSESENLEDSSGPSDRAGLGSTVIVDRPAE